MSLPKCNKALIDKVRPLIERGQPFSVIAKACGISRPALFNYKNPDSEHFNQKFADMVKEAMEARDTGLIRAGQFEQAKKHILKKVTKELRTVGPKMPPSYLNKQLLIRYADEVLDLILDPRTTVKTMKYECERRVEELTKDVWVAVKEDEVEVDPNQAAVKNVETNTGDPDERWTFKEEVAVSGDLIIKNVKFGEPEPKDEDGV